MRTVSPIYPGVYDRVEYKYNNLGQQIQVKDQNQTVHDYLFDKLGRMTEDSALGTNVVAGHRRTRSGGSKHLRGSRHGRPHDKLRRSDRRLGRRGERRARRVQRVGQARQGISEHDGDVVDANHALRAVQLPDADHGLRLESVRYPNGRILDYLYDSGIDDVVGRVSSLTDSDETHLADYTYLGLDQILGVSYPEPGITNDPILNGYDALDRFGRTAEVLWKSTASPFTPVADLKYGYDAVGNRTYRQDLTAESNGQHLDEVYDYDGVNQLLSSTRGHWEYGDPENDSFIADAAELSQSWELDATGNWDSITTNNGTTQDRDFTKANELTTADGWVDIRSTTKTAI